MHSYVMVLDICIILSKEVTNITRKQGGQPFYISVNGPIFFLSSGRPKRVNTESTETEISVKFTEPKPKLPKRN